MHLLHTVTQKEVKMKFSGIDMQGYFKAEMVVDASALSYEASDERRMVYDETTEQLWIADDTEWKLMGGYAGIPESTVMWVYADSPPDGWSLYSSPGDVIVAIKGGGTYTTGGSIQGSWATPAHSHGLANHTHVTSGTTGGGPFNQEAEWAGNVAALNHVHGVSISSTASSGTTGIGGSSSAFRPRARVGILCTR